MEIALINPKYVGVGGLKTVNENLSQILKAHIYLLNGGVIDSNYKIPGAKFDYRKINYAQYDAIILMFQPKPKDVDLYSRIIALAKQSGCVVIQRMHRFQPIPENLDIDCVACNSKVQQNLIPYYNSEIIRNPVSPLKCATKEKQGTIWFLRFGSGQTENIEYTTDKCTDEIGKIIKKFKNPVSVYGNHVGVHGWQKKKQFLSAIDVNPKITFNGACNTMSMRKNLICNSKSYINSTVHGWDEDIGTSLVEAMQFNSIPIASAHYLKAGYINKDMGLFFNRVNEIPRLLYDSIDKYDKYKPMLKANNEFIMKKQGTEITKKKYEAIM